MVLAYRRPTLFFLARFTIVLISISYLKEKQCDAFLSSSQVVFKKQCLSQIDGSRTQVRANSQLDSPVVIERDGQNIIDSPDSWIAEGIEKHLVDTNISIDSTIEEKKPGLNENERFRCDSSVQLWRDFRADGSFEDLRRAQKLITAASSYSSSGGLRRQAYWSSHLLRTTYFLGNAVVGMMAKDLNDRRKKRSISTDDNADGAISTTKGSSIANIAKSGLVARMLLEVAIVYNQDWRWIESKSINFPWDALVTDQNKNEIKIQLDHKQNSPLFALLETSRLIRESVGIFSRRDKLGGSPSEPWLDRKKTASAMAYPEYYFNDFHYQTDGWMSSSSASVYEVSTETLFLGKQDAMQRQTLIPLVQHFENDESPAAILEVACGTGRFATFTRDNFPKADMTLTDLSPFYLEKARQHDQYWMDYRGEEALKENLIHMDIKPAKFVQANAESLPFPDNSFDAVTCVYLFHELPENARLNAISEMARIVKPGGIIVLTDSIQLGDRSDSDDRIGNFKDLNEPHYENYISTEFSKWFENCGLVCDKKYVSSTTKTVSFIKPRNVNSGHV